MRTMIRFEISFIKRFIALSSFGLLLLILRIFITKEIQYLFLCWNLFLAFIPYLFSSLLIVSVCKGYKVLPIILFGIWLSFYPNAPYLLTDFLHLKTTPSYWITYDTLLIASFAISGLYIGFKSLHQILFILKNRYQLKLSYVTPLLLFITGFGVYIGRFLRWNSWDILTDPLSLLLDIANKFLHPLQNLYAWLFSISFGGFLIVLFYLSTYSKINHQLNKL